MKSLGVWRRKGRAIIRLSLIAALATTMGCSNTDSPDEGTDDTSSAPQAAVDGTVDDTSQDSVESDIATSSGDAQTLVSKTTDTADDTALDDAPAENAESEAKPGDEVLIATVENLHPRRILLLAAKGPLVVDLLVSTGNRAMDDVVAESARKMLRTVDENGDNDGQTSWDEVDNYGGFGNADMMERPTQSRNRAMLLRSYDKDGNGLVNEAEFVQYYNRGQPASEWLVVRMPQQQMSTRLPTGIGQWLDTDLSDSIDTDELTKAHSRLHLRDANADGVLQSAEFDQPLATMFVPQPPTAIRANQIPIVHINEETDWSGLLYRLQNRYTFDAPLMSEDADAWPPIFHDLDQDQNGTIWDDELAVIADRSADMEVRFQLSAGPRGDETGEGRGNYGALGGWVQVHRTQQDTSEVGRSVATDTAAGRITFALAQNAELAIFGQSFEQGFQQLDQDDNDVLSENEFALVAQIIGASFDRVDSDSDGEVTQEELIQSYYSQQDSAMRVELWVLPHKDPVFAALDLNADRLLDRSELAGIDESLAGLDTDQDGIIQATELQDNWSVVMRVAPLARIAPPPTAASRKQVRPEKSVPAWFTATDANHDGAIQKSEFLGALQVFHRLDQDEDSVLTLDEALSSSGK